MIGFICLNVRIIGYGDLKDCNMTLKDDKVLDKNGKVVAEAKKFDFVSSF